MRGWEIRNVVLGLGIMFVRGIKERVFYRIGSIELWKEYSVGY